MLTRCPKCGKQIDEDADICKSCKYEFTKNVIKGTGRRVAPQDPTSTSPIKNKNDPSEVPPHMRGDAPGLDMRKEEDILPPHMLEGARQVDLAPRVAEASKGGGTGFYVLIGAVILGALAAPKLLKKKEPPPPPELTAEVEADAEFEKEEPAKTAPVEEKKVETKAPEPPAIKRTPKSKKKRKKRRPGRRLARAPAPDAPRPPPRASRAAKWRFRGKIIDIISLKPVADADLVFVAANGKRATTATGAGGDFRVSMPPAPGGYELRITHPDYDSKYLANKNHLGMDEDERKKVAEKLVSSYAKNLSVKPGGDGRMNQDYLLVPRPKHGVSLEEALLKGGAQ